MRQILSGCCPASKKSCTVTHCSGPVSPAEGFGRQSFLAPQRRDAVPCFFMCLKGSQITIDLQRLRERRHKDCLKVKMTGGMKTTFSSFFLIHDRFGKLPLGTRRHPCSHIRLFLHLASKTLFPTEL